MLMYVHESTTFIERNDLCPNSLEIICAEIKKPHNKSFLVSSWYRRPNSDINIFNDYESFLQNCETNNCELYVMGYFNCDVTKSSPDYNTRGLQFLSTLYQLDQIINEPTRVTITSASLIDLFFTNKRENISQSGVIHLGLYLIIA